MDEQIKPHHWITSMGRMSRRKPPKHCQPVAYYDQRAIDTLRAEVAEAWAAADSKAGWEWKKRAERAEAEADALRKDAERYRWLRLALLGAEDDPIDHLLLEKEPETDAEFDAAVDAAIDAAKQGAE